MPHKTYLIILCGAADRSCAELADRSPLEAARTPLLDRLTRKGRLGSITVINSEIPPESDSGAMALLSYDPLVHYTGRGPLEGLGLGFDRLGRYSVSFVMNFASYNAEKQLLERRTSRDLSDEELQALAEDIRQHVRLDDLGDLRCQLHAHGRHRGILCLASDTIPLSGNVSNTDPGFVKKGAFGIPVTHENRPANCTPLDMREATRQTAGFINLFLDRSARVLERNPVNAARQSSGRLPANLLLLRDGGERPTPLQSFLDRFGRTLSFHGQIPAEKGLAEMLGGRFAFARRGEHEDVYEYLSAMANRLASDDADVVAIHLKCGDEPGHDGDVRAKVSAIEEVDACFFGPLCERIQPNETVVATCDHATPCELKLHSADPVPVLVSGGSVESDETQRFTERDSRQGRLVARKAIELLPEVFGQGVSI
jgi:2,3-bisphosphoglycerate-independent phosphoglycerate mutase